MAATLYDLDDRHTGDGDLGRDDVFDGDELDDSSGHGAFGSIVDFGLEWCFGGICRAALGRGLGIGLGCSTIGRAGAGSALLSLGWYDVHRVLDLGRDGLPGMSLGSIAEREVRNRMRLSIRHSDLSSWCRVALVLALVLLPVLSRSQDGNQDQDPGRRGELAGGAEGGEGGETGGSFRAVNPWGTRFNQQNQLISIGGRRVHLTSDDSTETAVVITGSILVEGEVEDTLVVVAGSAEINGRVGGNVVIAGGRATFGPNAEIDGDTILVGGPFEIDPGALFHGEQTEVQLNWLLPMARSVGNVVGNTVLLARPMAPNLGWTWWLAGGLFVVNLMVLFVLPRPVAGSVEALNRGPLTAFLVGLSVLVVFGPFVVILLASGVGILLIPFLFCLALATLLVGKVTVYTSAGAQIVRQLGGSQERPFLAFTIGSLGFLVAYLIPVIGFMALGLVIPLGVGAVILALCHALRAELGGDSNGRRRGSGPGAGSSASTMASGGDSGEDEAGRPSIGNVDEGDSRLGARRDRDILGLAAGENGDRVGFWPRIVATLLDAVLVGTLFSILFGGDSGPGSTRFLLLCWLVYHIVFWALRGTTVGGMIMGLRCVTLEGGDVRWGAATIRALGSIFSLVALFVGFFWASWSRERQSWHDIIAGTTIIRVAKPGRVTPVPEEPAETATKPDSESTSPSFSVDENTSS